MSHSAVITTIANVCVCFCNDRLLRPNDYLRCNELQFNDHGLALYTSRGADLVCTPSL